MITYSRGSAALYRLPDGNKVLVEISRRDNRAKLHKVNFLDRPTKTLWQYDFPLPVADRSGIGSPNSRLGQQRPSGSPDTVRVRWAATRSLQQQHAKVANVMGRSWPFNRCS